MTGGDEGENQPSEPEQHQDPDLLQVAQDEIAKILAGQEQAEELEELPGTEELTARDLEQDIGLKKTYAWFLLIMLVVQLAIADAVFIVYAWAGRDWKLSSSVIEVWLGATLVEIVGIVTVITRYLFPRRDVKPKL